jgi:hypothetical protein
MSQGLCTSCGAAVNLAAGQDEINCTYCGTLVKRPEAEAQFNEVKNSKFGGTLLIAETAQEGGSYEEALNYYNKVIEQEPTFADGWLNKGICMVRSSKIGDLKIPEATSSWKAAIKFAKNPGAMKKRVAKEIERTVGDFYAVLESHYKQFSTLDNSYPEHVSRFLKLENGLALALELDPSNPDICTTGINLCEAVLSAARQSGTDNAAAALLNKDWKGAVTSFAGGYSAAAAIQKPVEALKYKYQKALSQIDPNFVPPASPVPEINRSNPDALKESLASLLKNPGGSSLLALTGSGPSGSIDVFPETRSGSLRGKVQAALDFLAIKESPDDCLLFEQTTNFLVTMKVLAWGTRKGFMTAEKKVVVAKPSIAEITYDSPGYFKDPKAPVVVYRNQFGVKNTEEIGSKFFKTQQYMYKANHERPEALLKFLQAWRDIAI